jgi:hypothetical protein
MIPRIMSGAVAVLTAKARPIRPVDVINQESGLPIVKTTASGESALKIGAAAIHLGPSTMAIISSAKSAQTIATGTVKLISIE